MRTRRIHLVDEDTVSALSEHCADKTRRAAAAALGLAPSDAAMISAVLNRKPSALSAEGEADLRRRLGRYVLDMRPVPVCPLHGEPHVADCHGREVVAVVALAPGDTVRHALTAARQHPRRKYLRPCLSLDPAVRLRQLERLTCAALAEQGKDHPDA